MPPNLFQTRSHSWREVGLAKQLSRKAVKRARIRGTLLLLALIGVLVVYRYRQDILGVDMPARVGTVIALLILGWQFARDVGRALGPFLFRRLDPATAGTAGFLVRLFTIVIASLIALRVAGLRPETLAVGGAFTAVLVGLAAQQTLGNLIAGIVLLSARPFRVGERVRLQGGGIAGTVEGVVSELGLLYTTFSSGDDAMLIPNSVVLNVAIVPLREPEGVELRARLPATVTPVELQEVMRKEISTPLRSRPRIMLEELDGDEVVFRISATPQSASDGPQLAGEILNVVAAETRRDWSPTGA